MNYKPISDTFLKISLIVLGIVLGFISFVLADLYSWLVGAFAIIGNICIVTLVYLMLRSRYINETREYLITLAKAVEVISDGESALSISSDGSKELQQLFEAIEKLRFNLKMQNMSKDNALSIINTLAVNMDLPKLLEELMPRIIEGSKSNWGAFYLFNKTFNKLELKSSHGFSKNIYKEFDISLGEGMIGKAALNTQITIEKNIPEDTVFVARTFLGKMKPRAIMTVPILSEGDIVGILVLASLKDYTEEHMEIVQLVRYYVGIAVTNCLTYERTQRLTSELTFRNQLIQNMNDELEEKVQERTTFLDNIINSITDYAIVSTDKNGVITKWNKGAELIYGYGQFEVVGLHIADTYAKEDREKIRKILNIAERRARGAECSWLCKKDGSKYYADLVITAMYDAVGELVGFASITKDITAIKNMENALLQEKAFNSSMFKDSTRALLLTDSEGFILNHNPIALNVLGMETDRDIIGRCIDTFFAESLQFKKIIKEIVRTNVRKEWNAHIVRGGNASIIRVNATLISAERTKTVKPDTMPPVEDDKILFYLA